MNETLTINGTKGEPWTSPDGKVTIWTLITDKGERRTMSQKLSQTTGSVEVEKYVNSKGKEYIRNIKKNGSFGGKGGGGDIAGIEVGHAISCACTIIHEDDIATIEAVARQILKLGDKLKAERRASNATAQPKSNNVVAQTPLQICQSANLGKRISDSGMPEDVINEIHKAFNGNNPAFIREVNQQLLDNGF